MVLLEDVVEIFDLADFNARLAFRIAAFDRRRVGPAFVDCDLLSSTLRNSGGKAESLEDTV